MERLFSIKRTQIKMVQDRGYEIVPDEERLLAPTTTVEDFVAYASRIATAYNTTLRSGLSRVYESKELYNGAKKKLYVFYGGKTDPQQKQVPADVIRKLINDVQSYGIDETIIIVDAALSSTSNKELVAVKLTPWQVFDEKDLTYNPTEHILTAIHTKIPTEEVPQLLQHLKAGISQLTLMSASDVIAKYYGWAPGDVIRVTRDDSAVSVLVDKSINYRVISNNI